MGAGGDRQAQVQVPVDVFVRVVAAKALPIRNDVEELKPVTVEGHFQYVRFA